MSQLVIVFFCSFASVFLLGLQSKNVNHRRYLAAIVTSFCISISQFLFIRIVAGGDLWIFVSSAVGGCLGIATSIWFWDRFMTPKKRPPINDLINIRMGVLK